MDIGACAVTGIPLPVVVVPSLAADYTGPALIVLDRVEPKGRSVFVDPQGRVVGDHHAVVVAVERECAAELAVHPGGRSADRAVQIVRTGIRGHGEGGCLVELPPSDEVGRAGGCVDGLAWGEDEGGRRPRGAGGVGRRKTGIINSRGRQSAGDFRAQVAGLGVAYGNRGIPVGDRDVAVVVAPVEIEGDGGAAGAVERTVQFGRRVGDVGDREDIAEIRGAGGGSGGEVLRSAPSFAAGPTLGVVRLEAVVVSLSRG